METLHIKYDFDEALDGKKDILNTEANLIRIIKKIQNYKLLRAQSSKKKIELKTRLNELAVKINVLKKLMPKASIPKIQEIEIKASAEEIRKKISLEQELSEIQEKLTKLEI